ncbi:hypothetical protein HWV62_21884 [Athelia sp. TMB]|nr:hypothetical protein HWV62_21884 [Athelia sp. TMB]
MSANARGMHFDNFWTDERRMEQLNPKPQSPYNLAPIAQNSGPHVMPIEPRYIPVERDGGFALSQSISSLSRSISVASAQEEDMLTAPVPPPIATLSYDLTAVENLVDPQDLLAEIKYIEKLYEEARARVPARKARAAEELAHAIAEAKRIDDAAFEHSYKVEENTGPNPAPRSPINPTRAVAAFFCEHPFWGVPADPPSVLAVTCSRWKDRLKRCFCSTAAANVGKG